MANFVLACLSVALSTLSFVDGFAIEPWYAGLVHFGPLANDSSWSKHTMSLVGDYQLNIVVRALTMACVCLPDCACVRVCV